MVRRWSLEEMIPRSYSCLLCVCVLFDLQLGYPHPFVRSFARGYALSSTSVRFWRMSEDNGDPEDEYPFVCHHKIHTGHWDNIFSAKMLPFSTRLCVYDPLFNRLFVPKLINGRLYRVTAARDGLVKVFDVGAEITTFDSASPYSGESPTRSGRKQMTIQCHSKSVKRITTEQSPDVFLTVSEVSVAVTGVSDDRQG